MAEILMSKKQTVKYLALVVAGPLLVVALYGFSAKAYLNKSVANSAPADLVAQAQ